MDQKAFGTQIASVCDVALRSTAAHESCWTESVADGWLFLFTTQQHQARLMSVGASTDLLLGQSRLIAAEIASLSANGSQLPAYPSILSPVCGQQWVACGSAAMTFDPLCGEGAGNALREAILAAAVVRAEVEGAEVQGLLAHYSSRLLLGFQRHLQMCLRFYTAAEKESFWTSAVGLLEQGIEWCGTQPTASPRYRLVGFDLEKI